MPLVFQFEVTPYYAQVAMIDPANPDSYPEWETGQEEIVCGPSGVVVAVRPDNLGMVRIGVWFGAYSPGPEWARLATVPIRASGTTLVVGSVTGSRLREVQVTPGEHQLEVYVQKTDDGPDEVLFALDQTRSRGSSPGR